MARKKKTVDDIAEEKKISLWSDRILTKEVPIQDAVFVLQTISSDISMWIEAQSIDVDHDTQEAKVDAFKQGWYFCKFSIKDIKGLYREEKNSNGEITKIDIEPEYETITILHTKYECLSDSFMKSLRPLTLSSLYNIAKMMSFMNDDDIEALDFTTPSPIPKSNVTKQAKPHIEKLGEENEPNLTVLSNE
jgi:hypothetical protein